MALQHLPLKNLKDSVYLKTTKFEWILDDIRIENIISAQIWATKTFLRFRLYKMSDTFSSYNLVQHQGKLMMQT